MMDRLLSYDLSLWISLYLFYLALHVKFVNKWTALIYFQSHRELRCSVHDFRFSTIFGDLICLAPLFPWEYCIRGSWGSLENANHKRIAETYRNIILMEKHGRCFQVLATITFFAFFCVAPIITVTGGLNLAIIFALLYYVVALGILALLLFHTSDSALLPGRWSIWFECLFYPAAIAALPKAIAWRSIFHADFPLLAKSRSDNGIEHVRNVIKNRIATEQQERGTSESSDLSHYWLRMNQ